MAEKQPYRPNLIGKIHPEAEQVVRLQFDALQDHDDAIVALNAKIAALQTSVTTTIETVVAAAVVPTPPKNPEWPYLGVVNNQTGQATYTVQTTDNGSLVILNGTTPAVGLNSVVATPYFVAFTNEGVDAATLTPTSGTISWPGNLAQASLPLLGHESAWVYFDGTNWWAIVSGGALIGTEPANEFLGGPTSGSPATATFRHFVVKDYPFHDEVLTDGFSNIIYADGDVIMVVGVPN